MARFIDQILRVQEMQYISSLRTVNPEVFVFKKNTRDMNYLYIDVKEKIMDWSVLINLTGNRFPVRLK
jgi:hypothetical protein